MANYRFIDAGQLSYLKCPEGPAPRRIYLLLKIHKDRKEWPGQGKVPPGGPIIADCGSESYASAEYIHHFLAPLTKQHKSYLKDTNDFINNIAGIKAEEGTFIATIDVDSLYTNIDKTNGLEPVKQIFTKNPDPKRSDKDILELIQITFEFNKCGELRWVRNLHKIMLFYDLETLQGRILQIFENFEYSPPFDYCEGRVQLGIKHFLDTVVYKENRFKETGIFDTKVYFKPTDTLEHLHKKSHHPSNTFKGLIKSQIIRYVRICNNEQDVIKACRKLFAAL